jgi:hypothetical protein
MDILQRVSTLMVFLGELQSESLILPRDAIEHGFCGGLCWWRWPGLSFRFGAIH